LFDKRLALPPFACMGNPVAGKFHLEDVINLH
jgi:hypothetical protein